MSTSPPLLLLEDFVLHRDGRTLARGERWAVERGEKVLVTGASGVGKSSFLLALGGLVPEHAPGLELSGTWSRDCSRVGMVLQNPYAQLVSPGVEEEVAFALENAGWDKAAMDKRVGELLAFFSLEGLRGRKPWTLSGGEAQRLSLAAALAPQPDLVLLDEPLGYLDQSSGERLVDLATRAGDGNAWIVVDHAPWLWADWADTHYRLGSDGRLHREAIPPRPVRPALWARSGTPDGSVSAGLDRGAGAVTASPPALELEGLWAGYGKEPAVLRDFSLRLGTGETLALVGPSGSGKSTLFRVLTGQLKARAGNLRLGGIPWKPRPKRALPLTWVPQVPEHFFVQDSVAKEAATQAGRRAGRISEAEREREERLTDARTRAFGLQHLGERHPFSLSEGEKRRLNLVAALALDRPILLLDEPQFGLDDRATAALEEALARLQAHGTSIIVISHDPDFCARVAHRVVAIEPPAEAVGDPAAPHAVAGGGIGREAEPMRHSAYLALNVAFLLPVLASLDLHTPLVFLALGSLALLVQRPRRLAALGMALAGTLVLAFWVWLTNRLWTVGPDAASRAVILAVRSWGLTGVSLGFALGIQAPALLNELMQWGWLSPRMGHALFTALNTLPRLSDEGVHINAIHRVRLGGRLSPLLTRAVTLLARAIRSGERSAQSLASRGLENARTRTWFRPVRWRHRDSLSLVLGLGLAAAALGALVAGGWFRFGFY